MSISSVATSKSLYQPSITVPLEAIVRPDSERQQDPVQLSDRAKQLLATQLQPNTDKTDEKNKEGQESVQISSSIGKLSRVTGLQREEVVALYRSIDKLT